MSNNEKYPDVMDPAMTRDHSLRSMRSVLLENTGTAVLAQSGTTSTGTSSRSALPPKTPTSSTVVGHARALHRPTRRAAPDDTPFAPSILAMDNVAAPPSRSEMEEEEQRRHPPETGNIAMVRAGHLLAFGQLAFNLLLVGALLMVNSRMVFSIGEAVTRNDLQGTEQANMLASHSFALRSREIIFFIAQIFQFYLYLDSVTTSNRTEFVAFCGFVLISFFLTVVHIYDQSSLYFRTIASVLPDYRWETADAAANALGYALTSSSALFTMAWGAVGHRIFKEMRWKQYKELGASLDSKRRQTRHNGLQLMIKLGTFLMISFLVQFALMNVAGLGWTVFSPFISAYDLLMLGGGLYLFLVVGPEAEANRSPSIMSLFVVGCIVETVFILELCTSALTNRSAGRYTGDVAGNVVSLVSIALATVGCLVCSGVLAGLIARDLMKNPEVQVQYSAHSRPTSMAAPSA